MLNKCVELNANAKAFVLCNIYLWESMGITTITNTQPKSASNEADYEKLEIFKGSWSESWTQTLWFHQVTFIQIEKINLEDTKISEETGNKFKIN